MALTLPNAIRPQSTVLPILGTRYLFRGNPIGKVKQCHLSGMNGEKISHRGGFLSIHGGNFGADFVTRCLLKCAAVPVSPLIRRNPLND